MPKRKPIIPVSRLTSDPDLGIVIDRISLKDFRHAGIDTSDVHEETSKPHRHDGHSFFLLEKGTVTLEIDFRKYKIKPMSVLYMHPNQVHRTILSGDVTVSSWSLSSENLNPDYLKLLNDLTPAKPMLLTNDTFSLISAAVHLSIRISERKKERLYHSLLKDSCNALVALVISQYLTHLAPAGKISRHEVVTKSFKEMLENNYSSVKRPAAYARMLNISTSYLNECVKASTGFSVSDQIQQRVILEAKRLLFHSQNSVKEIAEALGFEDYPYFTRLFSKVTGMTALAFRNKNRD